MLHYELSLPHVSYSWNKKTPRGQVKTFYKQVLIFVIPASKTGKDNCDGLSLF